MSGSTPPRFTRGLLARGLPRSVRDEVLDDLKRLWEARCATSGRGAADRWYRSQAVRALFSARGRALVPGPETLRRVAAGIRRDLAFAFAQLRKHPGIGAVVVLTLAVAIGATTAIFSAVHGVLLRPLPYDDPASLVAIEAQPAGTPTSGFLTGPDYMDLARDSRTLSVAGLLETTVGPMTRVDRPEHIVTTPVTWNLFDLLGVDMAAGRRFVADDAVPADPASNTTLPTVAIISHGFWLRHFDGDPAVIGSTVHVWGSPTEIVGVLEPGLQLTLPPELNVPPDGDMWRAIRSTMDEWSREAAVVRTIGRITEGASRASAAREMETLSDRLRATHVHHARVGTRLSVSGFVEAAAAPLRSTLLLLLGAVGLVLLIACANVANLLSAHGAARAEEMAVRSSLGAERIDLVRQLLTESAVLSGLGVVGGVVLAVAGMEFIHAIRPADLHRLTEIRLDLPVLGFAVVLGVLTTFTAGIVPAFQASRADGFHRLRSRGDLSGDRSRDALVVAEVALSVVLLVGASLFVRSFLELQRTPLGFEPRQVLTVTATQSSRPAEERQSYEADLVRAVQDVPGVRSAGVVFPLPMNGVYDRSAEYTRDGEQADPTAWTAAYFRTVSPTYFETMEIDLLRGRGFTSSDEVSEVPVVVIDDRLGAREFGDANPVGRSLRVRGMTGDTIRAEIVGVVEYAPQGDHRDVRSTMYFPRIFYLSHEVSLVARIEGEPATVAGPLAAAVRAVDPSFPSDLVPMERYVTDRLARSRFVLILMQLFGGIALGLTAVGLYGVLSYSVRRRTRELGLRRALGAETVTITGAVLRSGLRLAVAGTALGVVAAIALGRGLRAHLYQVGVLDPVALAGTCALVLLVAVAASLVPAARAASIDPNVALQER